MNEGMSDDEAPNDEYENNADATQENLKQHDSDDIYEANDCEMDQEESQYFACEARWLAIGPEDLAEIGGFSTQFARDVLSWNVPFPRDVAAAIEFIEIDFNEVVAKLSELDELDLYDTNAELRSSFDIWPARGKSGGGFVGTHRRAVIEAQKISDAPINKNNDQHTDPSLQHMHNL